MIIYSVYPFTIISLLINSGLIKINIKLKTPTLLFYKISAVLTFNIRVLPR